MYPPTSILRRRFDDLDIDPFTDPVYDWHQPSDLDLRPSRSLYSPVRTPPRLRTYVLVPCLCRSNEKRTDFFLDCSHHLG